MSARPVLLVHGAWGGAWAWGFVQAELEKRGIASTAIDMPSRKRGDATTLSDDAAAVRTALAGLDGPAVLVGHSYAGEIITEASAGNDDVAHLVYVCAILPEEGKSTMDYLGQDPTPSEIGGALQMADDGTSTVSAEDAHRLVFNDATSEQFDPIAQYLGPHRVSVFGEAASALGWKEHPSTYVRTLQDKIFSPELQLTMAANATEVVELDTGHGPLLTAPDGLADVIAKAANAN